MNNTVVFAMMVTLCEYEEFCHLLATWDAGEVDFGG